MEGVRSLLRFAQTVAFIGSESRFSDTLFAALLGASVGVICLVLAILFPNEAPVPSSLIPGNLPNAAGWIICAVGSFTFSGLFSAIHWSVKRLGDEFGYEQACKLAAVSLERILAEPFERQPLTRNEIATLRTILRVASTGVHTAELLRQNRIKPRLKRPLAEVLAHLERMRTQGNADLSDLLDFANIQLDERGYFDAGGRIFSFRFLTFIVGGSLLVAMLRNHAPVSISLPVMSIAFFVPLGLERYLFRHNSESRRIVAATKVSVLAAIEDAKLSRNLDEDQRRLLNNLSQGDRAFASAARQLQKLSQAEPPQVGVSG